MLPVYLVGVGLLSFGLHARVRGRALRNHRREPVGIPMPADLDLAPLYVVRNTLTRLPQQKRKSVPGHGHPRSAADRAAATRAVDEVRSVLGAKRYDISSSAREEAFKDTELTCNHHHFVDSKKPYPRDGPLRRMAFVARARGFDIREDGLRWLDLLRWKLRLKPRVRAPRPIIVSCIDTKYYHDLPLRWFPPETIYCSFGLNPKHAAYSDGAEGYYHLDGAGVVHHVTGGGLHRHRAIDDTAAYASGPCQGGTTHYDCAHKPYPGDRLLTFWIPNAWSPFTPRELRPLGLAAPDMNNTVRQAVSGNFVSIDVVRDGDMWRSITGLNDRGSWCLEVPTSVVNACLDLPESGLRLELKSIGALVRNKVKVSDFDVMRFAAYLKSEPLRRCTTYTFAFGDTTETSVEDLPTPVVPPALSTTSDTANLKEAFTLRMKEPLNKPTLKKASQYRDEWVAVLGAKLGKVRPWSRDDVEEYQTRKAQRDRNTAAVNDSSYRPSPAPVKAFVKLETSSGSCKPRQIVQLGTEFNLEVCRFSLALSKAMRVAFGPVLSETGAFRSGWYCVGASPDEIARQMAEMCRFSKLAGDVPADCDYSSFDGSVSMFDRHMLRMVCDAVFDCDEDTFGLLHHLLDTEARLKVVKGDMRFEFQGQIVSGSGWTSLFGTMKNGYNIFCTLRELGVSVDNALAMMSRLALFGDDGAAPKRLIEKLAQVAEHFGQKVTHVVREGRVSFLSRDFLVEDRPALDSIACMPRALQKLCCGLNTSEIAMRATCAIGMTPLLGVVASKVVEFKGERKPDPDTHREAWFKYQAGTYPERLDEQFYAFVAEDMGVTIPEVLAMEAQIAGARSWDDLCGYLQTLQVGERAIPDGARYAQ